MTAIQQPFVVDNGLTIRNGVLQLASVATSAQTTPSGAGAISANPTTGNIDVYNNAQWNALAFKQKWTTISSATAIGTTGNDLGFWANTTTGSFTISLPSNPVSGYTNIYVGDYAGTFGTNAVTVAGNGNSINGGAVSGSIVLNAANTVVEFLFVDATQGWKTGLIAGAPSGVATLDSTGHIPIAQIPTSVIGALNYQGVWNATTNIPALVSGTGTKGYYYQVSVAGSTTLDGNSNWYVGDIAAFNGTNWEQIRSGSDVIPITLGGTGATSVSAAQTNLQVDPQGTAVAMAIALG